MAIKWYLKNFRLISPSCKLYEPEARHSAALDPSPFLGKIMRYMPQPDIQDHERDNPHRAEPENRMYPTGYWMRGAGFEGAVGPSPPIDPGV